MSGGWYITNRSAVCSRAAVEIYADIGAGGIRAGSLLASIGQADEVDLRISSDGGDPFDAVTMYNRLRERERVWVTVDGLAASAASIVAMAASPGCLAMAPHSQLMIHEAHAAGPPATAAELAAQAALLDGLSDEIAGIYARRAGGTAGQWRAAMKRETWFSASEAVAAGLADVALDEAAAEWLGAVRALRDAR